MRRPARPIRRSLILAALVAVPVALASNSHAIDEPHLSAISTEDQCGQCHSGHGGSGFFLINVQYINDLCLACHDGVTATQVETHLNPTKGPWQGRDYDGSGADLVCVDCHDPHNQRSALGQHYLGYLGASGTNRLRTTPGGARTIVYDSTASRGSFIKNNPDNGICEVCHSVTEVSGTPTFRFGDDADSHFGQAAAQACTACHDHTTGFTPQGGDCVGCHSSTQGSIPRRQITDQLLCTGDGTTSCTADADCQPTPGGTCGVGGEFGFGFTSHHVNDGTGSQLATKWDCVVCHAEGNVLTGETDATYHLNDGGFAGVQLKNADTGVAMAAGDWSALTSAQRSDFCLSCHDDNGATAIAGRTDPDPDATTDALNPFNDGVTNAHEGPGGDGSPAPHTRGRCSVTSAISCVVDEMCPGGETCALSRVVNVTAQYDTLNASHHAVLAQSYITPPGGTELDFSLQGFYPTGRTDLDWTSTLNCEDCHYGTGTNMLQGHGTANSRYMLRDEAGNDALGSGNSILCFRCHMQGLDVFEGFRRQDPEASDNLSVYPEHDKAQHIDDSLNLYGISCLNCHGGGEVGGIHGVDFPVTDDDSAQTYNPNVFTYGSGLDRISNWTGTAGTAVSCSARGADWLVGNCTQHDTQTYDRGFDRTYRAP